MTGNLTELCLDGYQTEYYADSPTRDPSAPWTGSPYRPCRGGAFFSTAASARSACRDYVTPTDARGSLGMRPARRISE